MFKHTAYHFVNMLIYTVNVDIWFNPMVSPRQIVFNGDFSPWDRGTKKMAGYLRPTGDFR